MSKHTFMVGELLIKGSYTPAYTPRGRGEPALEPPEPAMFEIEEVIDENGVDIGPTMTCDEFWELERECLILVAEEDEGRMSAHEDSY